MNQLYIYLVFICWVTFLMVMFDYYAFGKMPPVERIFTNFFIALLFPFALIYVVIIIILGLDKDDK